MIDRLLAIHPHLAELPDDAPEGLDSPLPPPPPINWSNAGNVFPVEGEQDVSNRAGEETEGGEGHVYSSQKSDDGEHPHSRRGAQDVSWEDWALCLGAEIMAEVREEVWKQLHYTCSAVRLIVPIFSDTFER